MIGAASSTYIHNIHIVHAVWRIGSGWAWLDRSEALWHLRRCAIDAGSSSRNFHPPPLPTPTLPPLALALSGSLSWLGRPFCTGIEHRPRSDARSTPRGPLPPPRQPSHERPLRFSICFILLAGFNKSCSPLRPPPSASSPLHDRFAGLACSSSHPPIVIVVSRVEDDDRRQSQWGRQNLAISMSVPLAS